MRDLGGFQTSHNRYLSLSQCPEKPSFIVRLATDSMQDSSKMYLRVPIAVQINLFRTAALLSPCLIVTSLPLFAQLHSDVPGKYSESTGNVAEASLRRAIGYATLTAFSFPASMPVSEPARLDDVAFFSGQAEGKPQNQTKPPSGNPQAPSLPDLFPSDQTQGNARQQALLDKRSHMLKIHQRLGLITIAPLLATVISSGGAAKKNVSTTSLDLHAALGGVTAGMYFSTAYFAIFAPKLPGTRTRGPIRLHRDLAWVHGPGMILTAVLGGLAYEQRNRGEKVHGIASAHSAVGWVTAGAFGAAVLSVSLKL
jgi:hypothetical protein